MILYKILMVFLYKTLIFKQPPPKLFENDEL